MGGEKGWAPSDSQVPAVPAGVRMAQGSVLLPGGRTAAGGAQRDTGTQVAIGGSAWREGKMTTGALGQQPAALGEVLKEEMRRITLFEDRSRARGACGGCCGVSVVLVLWARRSPCFLLGSALCLQSVRENGGSHELPRGVRMREFSGCISSMRYKRAAAHLKRVAKLRPPRPGAEPAAELLRGGSAPHTALSGALSALSPSSDRKSPQVSVAAFRRCRGDAARALPEAWWVVGGRDGGVGARRGGPAAPLLSCRPQASAWHSAGLPPAAEERGGRLRAAKLRAAVERERQLEEAVRTVRAAGAAGAGRPRGGPGAARCRGANRAGGRSFRAGRRAEAAEGAAAAAGGAAGG